jgi:peptidoglycan hydrolase FlgJ
VAINPPSDIVLDVVNAADPARAEAVAERLNALSANAASAAAASGDFTKVLDDATQSAAGTRSVATGMANARAQLMKKDLFEAEKTKHAKVELEATLLNNLVGEMLPKDAPGVFGQGSAGDVWRSMLGEQIAHQIAKSGELGIADRLFATHALPHESGKSHASLLGPSGPAHVTLTSANLLSMPTGANFSNGSFLFTSSKRP